MVNCAFFQNYALFSSQFPIMQHFVLVYHIKIQLNTLEFVVVNLTIFDVKWCEYF